ncbi:hypothetical protein BDY21DRAFT_395677 [Lineolata rhizophorae]|uniref:Uncharacterized protein n=1 Tax=Lineolata rhizophorae TaxID=578093 RepID=A0A6A6NW62_9PEZI|nr:hypothetical protein BDY21DRAFT_395677 [Lineolata rhizophorae]
MLRHKNQSSARPQSFYLLNLHLRIPTTHPVSSNQNSPSKPHLILKLDNFPTAEMIFAIIIPSTAVGAISALLALLSFQSIVRAKQARSTHVAAVTTVGASSKRPLPLPPPTLPPTPPVTSNPATWDIDSPGLSPRVRFTCANWWEWAGAPFCTDPTGRRAMRRDNPPPPLELDTTRIGLSHFALPEAQAIRLSPGHGAMWVSENSPHPPSAVREFIFTGAWFARHGLSPLSPDILRGAAGPCKDRKKGAKEEKKTGATWEWSGAKEPAQFDGIFSA